MLKGAGHGHCLGLHLAFLSGLHSKAECPLQGGKACSSSPQQAGTKPGPGVEPRATRRREEMWARVSGGRYRVWHFSGLGCLEMRTRRTTLLVPCHPSAPVASRSQQRLTPREESRKRAFLPVRTLRRRGTPGRVFCVQTDGRTRTLRVYTLPSHTVLPPPEQRGVHFVPTHQPVLPYPVRACRHKPCLQHLARD